MAIPVTLIPGDGIGPEVVNLAVEAIEAAGARLEWHRAAAGAGAVPTHGTPIPAETLESIRRTRLALKGPLATPIGEGYRSVNVALRKEFDLYANILSDLTSGLIGGLGLTAGANIGHDAAIFEAVHGTAPDIAGKGVANPTAVMLAGAMLLEHIGERTAAEKLVAAIREAIASKEATTRDLGGNATSRMFTNAVLKRLR